MSFLHLRTLQRITSNNSLALLDGAKRLTLLIESKADASTRKRVFMTGATVALAGYAAFLFRNLSYAIGGPDTGGYFNQARMIAAGRMTRPVDLVRLLKLDDSWLGFFMPLGFAPSPHGTMHPTYPPGLPMHLALAGTIGGWEHAPFFVVPLAAAGSLVLLFAIARKLGLSNLLSFAAAVIFAFIPPFLWHAVQPASDVLATFWGLMAIFCALAARERPWTALVAGAAFAIGVWVRPTNVFLIFALPFALRGRLKLLAYAAVAALPFGLALLWWNATLYGSPTRTGYGNLLDTFSWEGVVNVAPQYIEWLTRMLTPAVFPAGLFVLFDRRAEFWTRWMLITWFVPLFLFYSFYGFFDGWICVRFLLPAVPAIILGALIVLRDLRHVIAERHRVLAAVVASAITVWMCVGPVRSTVSLGVPRDLPHMEESYPRYVHWAEQYLPKRAIIVTGVLSGPFLYYSNRSIARFDQMNDDRFQLLRAYAGNVGLAWYAVVGDDEIDQVGFQQRFKGQWTILARLDSFTVYRLDS